MFLIFCLYLTPNPGRPKVVFGVIDGIILIGYITSSSMWSSKNLETVSKEYLGTERWVERPIVKKEMKLLDKIKLSSYIN